MIDINELRRRIDWGYKVANGVISELLDRLEAAEQDAIEQARLNGMGAERELALMAKLEAAEKERDEFKRACFGHISDNSMLRAKIAEMERQGPVAKVRVHQTGGNAGLAWSVVPLNDFDSLPLMRDGDRVYALPGAQAQPTPSVPDGWQLVPVEPTSRMLRATWTDAEVMKADGTNGIRAALYRAMLSAAPETKPPTEPGDKL